jgi:hypothetical protein
VTIVKKVCVTPFPFHHARSVTQISHLLNRVYIPSMDGKKHAFMSGNKFVILLANSVDF